MGEGRGSLSSLVVGESHEFRGLLRPSRTESNVEAKHRKCQNNCVLCGGPHSSGHIHPKGHRRFASSTRLVASSEADRELSGRAGQYYYDCYSLPGSSNTQRSQDHSMQKLNIVKVQHIIAWSSSSSSSHRHQSHLLYLFCASRRLVGKFPSALCSDINDGIESALTPLSFTFKLVPIFTLVRKALSRS